MVQWAAGTARGVVAARLDTDVGGDIVSIAMGRDEAIFGSSPETGEVWYWPPGALPSGGIRIVGANGRGSLPSQLDYSTGVALTRAGSPVVADGSRPATFRNRSIASLS